MFTDTLAMRFSLLLSAGLALAVVGYLLGISKEAAYMLYVGIGLTFCYGVTTALWRSVDISRRLNDVHDGFHADEAPVLRVKLDSRVRVVRKCSNLCMRFGIIGTVLGFMLALGSIVAADATAPDKVGTMVAHMLVGMEVALGTTLMGSICSAFLWLCYSQLEAAADRLMTKVLEQ